MELTTKLGIKSDCRDLNSYPLKYYFWKNILLYSLKGRIPIVEGDLAK